MRPETSAIRYAAIALTGLLLSGPLAALAAEEDFSSRVERVLARTPVIDGHNDLAWELRERSKGRLASIDLRSDTSHIVSSSGLALSTDIPRLRAGSVGAQFWSVWVPTELTGSDAVQTTLEQIDLVKRMVAAYPDDFQMAYTAADIRRIHRCREDRLSDWHRGWPPDQQLPRGAATDVRPRRPLHDADAYTEHELGGLSHGHARAPGTDGLRARRRPGDESVGDARRSQPCLGEHHETGACDERRRRSFSPTPRPRRSSITRATCPTTSCGWWPGTVAWSW